MQEYQVDATKKVFGRLASEVAVLLRGKNKADFQPHLLPKNKVIVSGLDKLVFTGKKMEQKKYYHYSGYPGGMKTRFLDKEWDKDPKKVFRMAVYRMLPKNRTRDKIIRNLIIK